MPYTPPPIEEVAVRDLHVDERNFRIADQQPNEAAIMNYLYDAHDVSEVATLILRDGYIDNELPIVVEEGGRYVIVEGNRRLTALRTLLEPSLTPSHQVAIERLLKRHALEAANLPDKIRVMVLPDRAAAAPVLARLHIGTSKRAWNLDEQAKFVLAQLTGGVTVQELRDSLPAIKDVPRLVRMGKVREVLDATQFADPAVADYVASGKLAMSAFEYAYRNRQIQEAVGLGFDREGNLVSRPSTAGQTAALERLVRGFMKKELSSRKFPRVGTEAFDDLLAELTGVHSEPDRRGTNLSLDPPMSC